VFLPRLLLKSSRLGLRLGVVSRMYKTNKAFVYSKIHISSKWFVKVKKKQKKKRKNTRKTKSNNDDSCALKWLEFRSSRNSIIDQENTIIKGECAKATSSELLVRCSAPSAGW
jgi:hypothetical protein